MLTECAKNHYVQSTKSRIERQTMTNNSVNMSQVTVLLLKTLVLDWKPYHNRFYLTEEAGSTVSPLLSISQIPTAKLGL